MFRTFDGSLRTLLLRIVYGASRSSPLPKYFSTPRKSPYICVKMSLYYDAAPLLLPSSDQSGSLKSRIFNSKGHKSSPKQIFAVVSEAAKWSPVLSEVIQKSQLLQLERRVRPSNHPPAEKVLTDSGSM